MLPNVTRLAALAAALLVPAFTSSATERRFAYTYETTTTPKGAVEIENWVTWKHIGEPGTTHTDLFQFRHELEFGITDRLQLGVYLFDWQYNRKDEEGHKARWEHSGFELIYSLTNPTTDFLGSALYFEAVAGESSLEIEGKLLLQKNFGPLRVAYNLVLEAEWEGEKFGRFDERNGEFAQTLGVSYDINKNFSVGAEVLHEIPLPEWSEAADSNVFIGPNASVRFGRVFVTGTALLQVTNVEGEPDAQVRLITGFDF
jgi:hypothetical protein